MDGFWCYEELGNSVSVARGGVDVMPLNANDSNEYLEQLHNHSLEAEILHLLDDRMNIKDNVTIFSGGINAEQGGSYGFTIVSTDNKTLVVFKEAYLLGDNGKTIERL